ncbi:hypothetical protein D3C72_1503230 [compost metagenome]
MLERQASGFKREITARDVMRIDRHACAAQCLNVALQAIMAQRHLFRPGDTANALMSQLLKIIHGVKGGGEVIDVDGRQLQFWRELIRHYHRRQIALLFDTGIKRQARAEQQHAVDLLGDNQVNKGFFLLILVGTIADQHQIALFRSGHFNATDYFAEEGIANIRHDNQNCTRFVTLYITPHGLRQIAHFQRRLLDAIARRLRDFIRVH